MQYAAERQNMNNASIIEQNNEVIKKASSYPYIIWDMDGTLIDSMPYWITLGRDYLLMHGITPPDDLIERLDNMTMEESARWFRELGLNQTEKEIIDGELKLIEEEYRETIPAKPFAVEIVKAAAENGSRMCVLTTSEKPLAEAVFKRLGLSGFFEQILTAGELHMDKRSGAIYEETSKRLGFDMEQTLICEDALYAVRGAKETRASVMAFRDDYYASSWEEIVCIADLHEN